MPRWVALIGPGKIMTGFLQGTSITKNSKTGEDLFITVISVHRTSRGREENIIYDPSFKAFSSLTRLLDKEIWQSLSNNTRINTMSTWSEMGCGMSSILQNLATKRKIVIYFSIITYLICIMWNSMSISLRRVLCQMHIWENTYDTRFHIWENQNYK